MMDERINAAAWERVTACIGGAKSLLATLDEIIADAERHEAYPRQHELLANTRAELAALRDSVRELQRHVWPEG